MKEIFEKRYVDLSIILSGSLIVLIIMQPWNLYFLNDDFEHIPMAGAHLVVTKNFLRPIPNLFLILDKYLYGKHASGYFFTTWSLHLACTVSVYFTANLTIKKYISDAPSRTALVTALFFLFYPFHAEPLFWIIARGAIIAALFAILSIYFYLKKNENNAFFVISLMLFIAALFTYETIWNLIFFYCLISFINSKNHFASARKEWSHAGISLSVFIAYFIVRYYSLQTITGGYENIDTNIFNFRLLLSNFIKLVSRNFTPPFLSTVFSTIFFGLSVIVYCLAIAFSFKKNKTVGWLIIILWAGVFSGVITAAPLGIDTHGNESERFIYYSSFYFCFFLAIAVMLIKKKAWKYAVCGFILILEITGLIVYNAHYRYTSAVVKTSLEFIKKYPNFKNAYFINVPGEYKGALIFRSGLPEAIRWIAPECQYDSVKIISQTEDASGTLPYKTGVKIRAELSREQHFNSRSNTYSLKDSLNRNIILHKNDAVFWFTKQGFYKVNL